MKKVNPPLLCLSLKSHHALSVVDFFAETGPYLYDPLPDGELYPDYFNFETAYGVFIKINDKVELAAIGWHDDSYGPLKLMHGIIRKKYLRYYPQIIKKYTDTVLKDYPEAEILKFFGTNELSGYKAFKKFDFGTFYYEPRAGTNYDDTKIVDTWSFCVDRLNPYPKCVTLEVQQISFGDTNAQSTQSEYAQGSAEYQEPWKRPDAKPDSRPWWSPYSRAWRCCVEWARLRLQF